MERIKDCKTEHFASAWHVGQMSSQHSHVTRSQHVRLHVGPAKVILNTMLQVCTPRVGWMSASVGHEIFSAATVCFVKTETPP